jgi:putative transposase
MQAQGHLTVEQMCGLAGVSRAGFYRQWRQQEPQAEEMELRAAVQQVALEHRRRYGYRRITAELRQQGRCVNGKRVARIMAEDNLLAIRNRKFLLGTTNAQHDCEVYWNLAARLELTGINQLWVADLTYIRLREAFVYLAVVLDAFSRRVVGWALEASLQAELATGALRKAILERKPPPGLVHHSDRGIQYACDSYVALLREHGICPSMSRAGNPYDNATCESFIKTLKQEEIYAGAYRDRDDLEANIAEFIEQYYNRRRLHSALGYRSPEQFENRLPAGPSAPPAAKMSFLRHEKSIAPM